MNLPFLNRRFSAALLIVLSLSTCSREEKIVQPEFPGAPVILISIDTLRADHLPAYGYKDVETPAIDAFRKDSILFSRAWSHVPLTLPSHVALLTGQLPPDNGVRNNIGYSFDPSKHPSIMSLLKERGYATGAAVSAYVLRGNTGLARAFDFYDDRIEVPSGVAVGRLQRPGGETEAAAEQWISTQGDKPFFFFFHIFEPHTPYEPAEQFKGKYADHPYDGEIATSDAIVGRFIDYLKQRGIYDRAVVILLSDHGEGLNDHGEDEHGIFLYRETIHVPLMLKLPKSQRANETVDAPVELIDVLPTIAAIEGMKTERALRGSSLLDPPADRRIYSETFYPRIHLGWSALRSIVDSKFHFIDAPKPELYDLKEAAEKANVLPENRRVYASMQKDLEPFSRELPAMSAVDPEEAKKLAALGYLTGSAAGTGALADPKDRIGDIQSLKDAARLQASGRSADAIALLKNVVAANPGLTDAWSLLGHALEDSGRFDEAIDAYKRAIEAAPTIGGEVALSLANVYLIENKPDEAAKYAALGAKANPGNAHVITGRSALAKGDFATAEREANAAIDTFEYHIAGIVLLAQLRVQQRRLPEAAQTTERALAEVQQKHLEVPPLLYFVRGDVLARMNRMPEAIAAFEEEIRRYPHDRGAYVSLAVVHFLSGRPAEADATMERLVRANPGPASCRAAAETFHQLGVESLAAKWRERAK